MNRWQIINSLADISIGSALLILETTKQTLQVDPTPMPITTVTPSVIIPTSTPNSTVDPWPPMLMASNHETKELNTTPIVLGIGLIIKGLAPVVNAIYEKIIFPKAENNIPLENNPEFSEVEARLINASSYGSMDSLSINSSTVIWDRSNPYTPTTMSL